MKSNNPITQKEVVKSLYRANVKPEDIEGAEILEGESNEYITQYSNGLMVRELKENDPNPYIKKFVNK